MKHFLSVADRAFLDQRISEAEKITGAQIVLATAKRCDSYAEIPWKAFSLGASISSLIVFILSWLVPFWITNTIILLSVASILALGIILAAMTLIFPGFARLFLSPHRKETETLQYAEALFLSNELFATEGRRGLLLLISQFERQVVMLPDIGVRDKLSPELQGKIISKMIKKLKKKLVCEALEIGLKEIQVSFVLPKDRNSAKNELSNEIIEEEQL